MTESINYWLALATLVLQIVGVAFLALFFLRKKFADLEPIALFLETWGLWIGFLITLGGVILSLFYSEILGVLPCGLCWFQRVFLYPQAILFALAIWKKSKEVADYSIALSIFGGAIALYQHYLQMGGTSLVPCPAVASQATDCAV
ncbi:MAG: disulfide bond formation protein B, partial [Candidatus Kaiserbacteria bacterium]|nr:disulfide bond formation protein B [Candidatus Kaiserbacteria bacterium]